MIWADGHSTSGQTEAPLARADRAAADLAASLADLLAREAMLLQSGAFDALEGLATEKEALAADLTTAELPLAEMRRLQAAAHRNALLLDAAREGLSAARRRLAELAAPPPALHTYDGSGRRAPLQAAPPQTSRRS
jgi:hypothetical protein